MLVGIAWLEDVGADEVLGLACGLSVDSCLTVDGRFFRGYRPLRDGTTRQVAWLVSQLLHGCLSTTSQRTLRWLHSLQARLARERLWSPFIVRTTDQRGVKDLVQSWKCGCS